MSRNTGKGTKRRLSSRRQHPDTACYRSLATLFVSSGREHKVLQTEAASIYISSRRFGHAGSSRHVVPSGGRDYLYCPGDGSRCIPGTLDLPSQPPGAQHVQRVYSRLHVQGRREPLHPQRPGRVGKTRNRACQSSWGPCPCPR